MTREPNLFLVLQTWLLRNDLVVGLVLGDGPRNRLSASSAKNLRPYFIDLVLDVVVGEDSRSCDEVLT